MKKLWGEFKKFISRGSVMDLAVGTIIGAAFTAIVTALSNGILKPLINWIIYKCAGGNSDALSKMYTVLAGAYTTDADGNLVLDTANSIYIDWGAFISAILNFFLIAVVLFAIIKSFNKMKETQENINNKDKRIQYKLDHNLPLTKFEKKYYEQKQKAEAAIKEAQEKAAAEEALKPKAPTTEELLTQIRDLLSQQNTKE